MTRVLASVMALTVIAGTAARIDRYWAQTHSADQTLQSGDIVYRMLGELREIVSAGFLLKADEYFHGGTRHPAGEDCRHEPAGSEGEDHARHAAGVDDHPAGGRDFWERLHTAIYERPVHHVEGPRLAELLPWFYLATRIDSHNVNAYVLGGYWLSITMQKPEEAIVFLQEGLRYNPDAWQIYSQLGDTYFIVQHDYAKAWEPFRRAYELLPADAPQTELRHILTLLSAAGERSGRKEQAAVYRRRLDELFPDRPDEQSTLLLPGA